jgi:hypothetical protein
MIRLNARRVVEDHCVCAEALLQRELPAGMPRIDGVDLHYGALAIIGVRRAVEQPPGLSGIFQKMGII